ncbi:MAG: alpha/beta hydrolase [Pseudomonadota bacterium]
MIHWVGKGLLTILIAYMAFTLLIWSLQRQMLYYPEAELLSSEMLAQTGFASVAIPYDQDDTLTAYWKPASDSDQPVFLHLHGNAGNIAGRLPIYQILAEDGAAVLAVGYPGYGGNSGQPNEEAFYAAAEAHYSWLIAQGIAPQRIVIFGQSIGTGPAVWLAAQHQAAGLMLEAPYTGIDDIAAQRFPFLPARWLVKDRYRNIDRIGKIDMPLLWIHGRQDDLIPYSMGEELFAAAQAPKTAMTLDQAGHNDIWAFPIGAAIRREALNFIAKTLATEKPLP